MVRQVFVFIHRWAGLAMAVFLIIVGLTGSVLAFREELDVWLNPELLTVAKRDAPLLDGFTLRERAAALYPDERFDDVPLRIEPDRSAHFSHMPGMNAEDSMMEKMVQFYLDPYSGEKLGERPVWSGPSLERKNLISFLCRLHFSLASPFGGWYVGEHSVGAFILGVTALVWTIDCFIAFYLTFPLRLRATGDVSRPAKSWLSRWRPAWAIKLNGSAYRINFDIHRAFGLWTWAMLFVFAWSSVAFNLGEVYTPTMRLLFGAPEQTVSAPAPAKRIETPVLGWREAYARGSALLHGEAKRRELAIERENFLSFNRDGGVYTLSARSSGDVTKTGMTSVSFDADTGDLREASFPGDSPMSTGDVMTSWLIWLHVA
ncbi:MAG TPA: PepSY-associated TM helix domain-containing protein, partial [Roseiarcus sp.]|nr:PepSY-associated TM helix domain-containing protein [Roseiarcus sp.]